MMSVNKRFTTVVESLGHEPSDTLIFIETPVVNTPGQESDRDKEIPSDKSNDVKKLHQVGGYVGRLSTGLCG